MLNEAIFSGDAYGRIRVWDSASVQHGSRAVLCTGLPLSLPQVLSRSVLGPAASGGGGSAAILSLATLGDGGRVCEGPPLVISGAIEGKT